MRTILIFLIYVSLFGQALCDEVNNCPIFSYSVGKLIWNTDSDEIIVQAVLPNSESPSFETELVFCQQARTLFSYKGDATFVGMYPLADVSQKIVTLWISGNGTYLVRVFGYSANKVSLLLDIPSFSFPEIIFFTDIDKKVEPSIVVSKRISSKTGSETLTSAEVFSWSGNAYKSNGLVEWNKRLNLTR
jgi:hypothetical protein